MPGPMQLLTDHIASPIGEIIVIWDRQGLLRALEFEDCAPRLHRLLQRYYRGYELTPASLPHTITKGFARYFAGDTDILAQFSVGMGGTAFQRRVWRALQKIAPGSTATYGDMAGMVGCPSAARAVGAANGANPLGIIVPCHRLIGTDGALTGYGSGLWRKRWLLDHERKCKGAG